MRRLDKIAQVAMVLVAVVGLVALIAVFARPRVETQPLAQAGSSPQAASAPAETPTEVAYPPPGVMESERSEGEASESPYPPPEERPALKSISSPTAEVEASPGVTQLPVPILKPIPVRSDILAGEKIAFLKDNDLWLVNVATRALAPATESGNVSEIFGWSHDGSQLLLGVGERPVVPETDMPGGTDLWVVNADGTNPLQLTTGLEVMFAAWSPVDSTIAYVTNRGELNVVQSDGSGLRKMPTKALPQLSWHPDGTKLAFLLPPPTWEPWNLLEAYDIAVLNLVDGSVAQLTSHAWENRDPNWSLVGEKLLFQSTRDYLSGNKFWYTMNTDGSDLRHLETPELLVATNVERSPVSDQISFDVSREIWVMDFEGTAKMISEGSSPAWSPDGTQLAYVGKDGGLWVIGVDGAGATKLSDAAEYPDWVIDRGGEAG